MKQKRIIVKKASLDGCIQNGVEMGWNPKRIASTLHCLGYSYVDIGPAMELAGLFEEGKK